MTVGVLRAAVYGRDVERDGWPSVSVVMPIRNEAEGLERAVSSELEQEYPVEFDVCLAIAPSDDDTEAVAAQLAAADDQVLVVGFGGEDPSIGSTITYESTQGATVDLTVAGIIKASSPSTRVIGCSPAASAVMDTKGQRMVAGDFVPQAKLSQHLKDVRLILAEAENSGCRAPLSELHRALLERAEELGFGEADNSAIIEAFRPPQDTITKTKRKTP